MKSVLILIPASFAMASTAAAQEAPAAPPQEQSAPASADISDEEVSRFAMAALLLEQIAADDSIEQEEKQGIMVGAVQQVGIAPERFNQIAQASQQDEALVERINLAAAAHVEAARQNQ